MSATSQLEVYKIILPSKTTYGDLVQGKFYAEKSPQQTDFAKFKKLYKAFLEKLIKNNVWEYKDKKKGLTVFRQEPNSLNKNDFHKIKISLKRAILITLALEYRKDENKSFYHY